MTCQFYKTARWQKKRALQLKAHPLCALCQEGGRTTAATVADHVIPHKGDEYQFWHGVLQSLCEPCHNTAKKMIEAVGYTDSVGTDGWPTDPRHPVNKHGTTPRINGHRHA